MAAEAGVTVPTLLKALGLYPLDASHGGENIYVNNFGERLPFRGGNWANGVAAGVFALRMNNTRANSDNNIGFRAALLSKPDAADLRVCFQRREDKGACFHAERQKT
jgi:sulfatase modifying factor 1